MNMGYIPNFVKLNTWRPLSYCRDGGSLLMESKAAHVVEMLVDRGQKNWEFEKRMNESGKKNCLKNVP